MAQVCFLPNPASHVAANPVPTPRHGHPTPPLIHLRRLHPTSPEACANNPWQKKNLQKPQECRAPSFPSTLAGLKSLSVPKEEPPSQALGLRLQHPSLGLWGGWWEGCGTGAGTRGGC